MKKILVFLFFMFLTLMGFSAVSSEEFPFILAFSQKLENLENHMLQILVYGYPSDSTLRAKIMGIQYSPGPSTDDALVLMYYGNAKVKIPEAKFVEFSEKLKPGTKVEIKELLGPKPLETIIVGEKGIDRSNEGFKEGLAPEKIVMATEKCIEIRGIRGTSYRIAKDRY